MSNYSAIAAPSYSRELATGHVGFYEGWRTAELKLVYMNMSYTGVLKLPAFVLSDQSNGMLPSLSQAILRHERHERTAPFDPVPITRLPRSHLQQRLEVLRNRRRHPEPLLPLLRRNPRRQ